MPSLVALEPDQTQALGDDRVGRALEALFGADRASTLTTLTLRIIDAFGVQAGQLHNDSTSIRFGRPVPGRGRVADVGEDTDRGGHLRCATRLGTGQQVQHKCTGARVPAQEW
jgi:hypothetical protein